MWAIFSLSLLGGVAGDPSPDGAMRSVVLDLAESVPVGSRYYTRYLALWPYAEVDRSAVLKSLAFQMNSCSWNSTFGKLTVVQGGTLVRFDLREFGWDRVARSRRLANAEAAGASFNFKDAAEKFLFLDPWEALIRRDPYFFSTAIDYGTLKRGWIDPGVDYAARQLSYSGRPVLRADWFLTQLSLDRPLGFYSDFLGLPKKEADLFKMLGADLKFIDREELTRGGAALTSIVALRNRELQLFPTLVGGDQPFLWRSLDVKAESGKQSVLENFAGTLKPDGKELIYSLPNGLHGYYVCNGAGDQVGEVPIDIAQDKQDAYDNRVISSYKCVSCHGPSSGINSFTDVVARMALSREAAIATESKDKDAADALKRKIEGYYLTPIGSAVKRHQETYGERVKVVNGLVSEANSVAYVGFVNQYRWGRINLDRAAIELGFPRDKVVGILKASGNPHGLTLTNGISVSREVFEVNFGELARAARYSWEK